MLTMFLCVCSRLYFSRCNICCLQFRWCFDDNLCENKTHLKQYLSKSCVLFVLGLSSLSFGSNRSNETVPTAHVIPNLLQSNSLSPRMRGRSNLHRYPSDDTLHSRHGSSDRAGTHSSALGDNHSSATLSHRWSSQNAMLNDRNNGDFHPLPHDANMTIDPTPLFRDCEDQDTYRSSGVTAATRQDQDPYRSSGVTAATRPARFDIGGTPLEHPSGEIPGHSPTVHSEHVSRGAPRDYQYSGYPHTQRDPLRTASPANPDRATYPYSQTPTANTYNAHNYSQEYSYTPYAESHSNIPHTPSGGDQFSSDLTSWQQKHQESLRRQQLEISQVSGD